MTHSCRTSAPAGRSAPPRASLRAGRRRGAIVILGVLLLAIFILFLALALNWIYLMMVQRDMQRRTDILALSGARELPDDGLLMELPFDQSDDLALATGAIAQALFDNNQVAPVPLQLAGGDLVLTAGHVDDVTLPITEAAFNPTPPAGVPLNTIRVEALRSAMGANPVVRFMAGTGTPSTSSVAAASYATVDSFVQGFRPLIDQPTPVAPIAINSSVWFNDRMINNDDTFNANGRRELVVTLQASDNTLVANGALVDFDGSAPLNVAGIPAQIINMIYPGDLPGGVLGPAQPAPGMALPLPATDVSPANTSAIVSALNLVAGIAPPDAGADKRRIFLLYDGIYSNPLNITGFIAADVLFAANTGIGKDRLELRIEPALIFHPTAWTNPADPNVPENAYIHKLRVSR